MRRVLFVSAAVAVLVGTTVPAQAGYYCPGPDTFQDQATNVVVMKEDCFGPTVARIDAGDELRFRNVDMHPHTVGGVAGTFGDGHREIRAGESVSFRFDDEGVFPYFCVIHPGMAGAVVVGDGTGPGAPGAGGVLVEPAPVSKAENALPTRDGPPRAFVMLAIIATVGLVAVVVLRRRHTSLDAAAGSEERSPAT